MSDSNVHKVWKALAVVGALVFLFLPRIQRSLPGKVSSLLLIGVLTYGVSLLFSARISIHRRWGMAYLALTGLTYLLVGLMGFPAQGGSLIAADAWYHIISPGPFLTVIRGLVNPLSFDISKLHYWIWPDSQLDQTLLSLFACLAGCMAIVAAFTMANNRRVAYNTWFALVTLSILGAVGYSSRNSESGACPSILVPTTLPRP